MISNKKWFTLLEIIMYILFLWFISYIFFSILVNLLNQQEILEEVDDFQTWYNSFIKNIYEKVYTNYSFDEKVNEWIIFKNNENYFGYACNKDWILETLEVDNKESINRSTGINYNGFECIDLNIETNSQFSWYNLNTNIWFLEREKKFIHYIKK